MTNFNPFNEMSFTNDRCFICGEILTNENMSEEHIYPKWLQTKFNLQTKKLCLLNSTMIMYKNLKIPCCKICNNNMGKMFEKPIERAIEYGYDEFIKLDKDIVFLWLNKMSYGILFKELFLHFNRANPSEGSIYNKEHLCEHRMQYTFLQSINSNVKLSKRPYSMLIFKIKDYGKDNYWSYDNPFTHTFFIRMNDIGIIAHLMDNSFNEDFFLQFPEMCELLDKPLHPIQFAELCAKFQYKSSLFIRVPNYILQYNNENKPENIFPLEISGIGYNTWVQKDYAKVLEFF